MRKLYWRTPATGMKNNPRQIAVIASSVTGLYHRAKNLPCQDYYKFNRRGKKIVAVVSDGAGSARYGKIGARIVCDTLCDILISAPLKDIRQKIIDAIDAARQKIIYHRYNKSKNEAGLIDFAATVVGMVFHKDKGIFFHIGDGAAIALPVDNTDNSVIISRPENGIFSCETYFYTMEDWKDCLRFTQFNKAESIMLMTDGVTGFAFKKDFAEIETNFIIPINRFLQETNPAKALRALNNTLSTPQACRLNPDDKTFLWADLR